MKNVVICSNAWSFVDSLDDSSIDHVVTDYPYGTLFYLDKLLRVCKGNIITFCASEDEPFVPTERAYWIKTPSTKNYSKHLGRFVEKIYVYRQGKTFNRLHWSQMTGAYTDLVIESKGHRCRKPLSLMERLVRIYTKKSELVLDPFCGSGTTLVACKNLGRSFIGVDNDPKWVKESKKILEEKE